MEERKETRGRKPGRITPETVKPNLRVPKNDWEDLKLKFPGSVNSMFCEWVKNNLK